MGFKASNSYLRSQLLPWTSQCSPLEANKYWTIFSTPCASSVQKARTLTIFGTPLAPCTSKAIIPFQCTYMLHIATSQAKLMGGTIVVRVHNMWATFSKNITPSTSDLHQFISPETPLRVLQLHTNSSLCPKASWVLLNTGSIPVYCTFKREQTNRAHWMSTVLGQQLLFSPRIVAWIFHWWSGCQEGWEQVTDNTRHSLQRITF